MLPSYHPYDSRSSSRPPPTSYHPLQVLHALGFSSASLPSYHPLQVLHALGFSSASLPSYHPLQVLHALGFSSASWSLFRRNDGTPAC